MSVPPAKLTVLENRKVGQKMTTLNQIENLGVCLQDNVCVFCSRMMDGWDRFCPNCNDYKGVMNVVAAVGYYGPDILGV